MFWIGDKIFLWNHRQQDKTKQIPRGCHVSSWQPKKAVFASRRLPLWRITRYVGAFLVFIKLDLKLKYWIESFNIMQTPHSPLYHFLSFSFTHTLRKPKHTHKHTNTLAYIQRERRKRERVGTGDKNKSDKRNDWRTDNRQTSGHCA